MTQDIALSDDQLELDYIKTFNNENQEKAYKHYCTKKILISLIKNCSKVVAAISTFAGTIAAIVEIFVSI